MDNDEVEELLQGEADEDLGKKGEQSPPIAPTDAAHRPLGKYTR